VTTTANHVSETTGEITLGFRQYAGLDPRGRAIVLRVYDDDTYGYLIDGKLVDCGQKIAEYSAVFDPLDGRDADSEALCFECQPGYDESEPYVFVHSRMYEALGVR
jgi:hypothetical protein